MPSDLRSRAPSSRVLAVGVVGVLLAAGLVGGRDGAPEPDVEASFPELAVAASSLVDGVDDGLVRLVVEVEGGRAGRATDATPGRARTATTGLAAPDRLEEVLDVLEREGIDHEVDGVDLDGRGSTGSERADVASSEAPTTEGDAVEPTATPLDGVEGIVEARWVDDERVAVATSLTPEAVAQLPGVEDVADDPVVSTFADASPTDPAADQLWGLDNRGQSIRGSSGTPGVDVGWTASRARATGAGVVVAVIDSGVDLDHPDLVGQLWRNGDEVCGNGADDDANGYVDDCVGWDFARDDATVDDPGADNGHGTHVAGTIAATADNGVGIAGVAPDATIMPLKIFDGGGAPSSRGAAAIRYAVDNGADVLNLSWGTRAGTPADPATVAAIEHARAEGVLVVAAAGNEGVDTDRAPAHPASLPHDNVLSVGAGTNGDGRASFSNHGRVTVDLFAPGHHVLSTVPGGGLGWASGTSMAAPHAAGVAALAIQHLGTSDASMVREAILRSAVPGTAYGSSATGGRIDAAELLGVGDGLLRVRASGVAGLEDGATADLRLEVTTSQLPDPTAELRLTLAHEHDGVLQAVVEHPLTLPDGTVVATTAEGRLPLVDGPLGPVGAQQLAVGMDLAAAFTVPAGRWALAVELLDPTTEQALGAAQLVLFEVAGDETEPDGTGPDGTSQDGTAPDRGSAGGGPRGGGPRGGDPRGGDGASATPPSNGDASGTAGPLPVPTSPDGPSSGTSGGGGAGQASGGGGRSGGAATTPPPGTSGGGAPATGRSAPPEPGAPGAGSGGMAPTVPATGGSTDSGTPPGTSDGGSGPSGGAGTDGPDDRGAAGQGAVTPDALPAGLPGVVQVRNPGLDGPQTVLVAGRAAAMLFETPSWLLVEVPALPAGVADVEVRGRDGQVVVHRGALTLLGEVGPGAGGGGSSSTVPPPSGAGAGTGGSGSETVPGRGLEPGPAPAPTTGTDGGGQPPTSGTGDGDVDAGPRRGVVGEARTLANGLRVAGFAADEPTHLVTGSSWAHRSCTTDPCDARAG